MLLTSEQKLDELIVRSLARQPHCSAGVLLAAINSKQRSFSVQGLHKELRKLQAAGVVVKLKARYSLNISWIFGLVDLADAMYDSYLEANLLELFLPAKKRQASWHFNSLVRANDFCINLMLILLRESPQALMYQWCPHPWYALLSGQEQQFLEALRLGGHRVYSIIGGRDPLDQALIQMYQPPLVIVSQAESPFEERRAEYPNVIGDYILSIILEPARAEAIDQLFKHSSAGSEFNSREVIEVLHAQDHVMITLERNAVKAQRFRKQFEDFFGAQPSCQKS